MVGSRFRSPALRFAVHDRKAQKRESIGTLSIFTCEQKASKTHQWSLPELQEACRNQQPLVHARSQSAGTPQSSHLSPGVLTSKSTVQLHEQHHSQGNICVATFAWQYLCGNICVATFAWQHLRGNICVATFAWQHLRGNATTTRRRRQHSFSEEPPWQSSLRSSPCFPKNHLSAIGARRLWTRAERTNERSERGSGASE